MNLQLDFFEFLYIALGGEDLMPVLRSKLDLKDSVFQQNKSDMETTLDELQALYDEAAAG